MWTGVFPAVTTKFTEDDQLDHAEMERCFALQIEAGCDGLIVCGSLGEGPMLSHDEKLAVLKTAQKRRRRQAGAADRQRGGHARGRGARQARREGRRRRADGGAEPDLPHQSGGDGRDAEGGRRGRRPAGDDLFQPHRLPRRRDRRRSWRNWPSEPLFVAIKESSDDIRRSTEIINRFGDRFDLFTGVDNLAFEALSVGAIGWVAGLVTAFPKRDGGDLPADEAGPPRRGAGDLPLVPAAARPRRVDLSGPEHQARGSACHRHQRPRAHAAPCRCRASAARRSRRSSRTRLRQAGTAEVLRGGLHGRFSPLTGSRWRQPDEGQRDLPVIPKRKEAAPHPRFGHLSP